MAYNWSGLGIPTMASWSLENLLSSQDWMPHHSKYGAECLEDFCRVADLQSTLELREATFRCWWRKWAAAGKIDVPTRKKGKQIRRSVSGLPLWGQAIFLPLNFPRKCSQVPTQAPVSQLIPNAIKLTILTAPSLPLLKLTIKHITCKSHPTPCHCR